MRGATPGAHAAPPDLDLGAQVHDADEDLERVTRSRSVRLRFTASGASGMLLLRRHPPATRHWPGPPAVKRAGRPGSLTHGEGFILARSRAPDAGHQPWLTAQRQPDGKTAPSRAGSVRAPRVCHYSPP